MKNLILALIAVSFCSSAQAACDSQSLEKDQSTREQLVRVAVRLETQFLNQRDSGELEAAMNTFSSLQPILDQISRIDRNVRFCSFEQ